MEYIANIFTKNVVKINSFNMAGNQLGDNFFSDICLGISKNSHLTKLFTNENELSKISSIILGTILRYDKKLKVIDLSKNNFDDSVINNIYKGLISNGTLEVLVLNENNLTNKSLGVLETTLHINSTLKELFLERNKFNNNGCPVISDILNKNRFLETFSIVGNKINNEGIDIILDRQRRIPIKIISKTDFYQTKMNGFDKTNIYEYLC